MDKKIFSCGLKIGVLSLFIAMALACTTSSSAVKEDYNGRGSNGNSEGTSIEVPVDSLVNLYEIA